MRKGKGNGSSSNGLLPNSLRIISSCIKTVSTNANTIASTVRSASASVASSVSAASPDDQKDQVLWAGFDKLVLGPSISKKVLLLGYSNGFQVLDIEDASNVSELVSKRGGPVTFLQMQPTPIMSSHEGFTKFQPLLLVVAGEENNSSSLAQGLDHVNRPIRDGNVGSDIRPRVSSPTAVRFYSLRSHTYAHILRFRSAVYMVRCSPRIVAVGLAAQIYCFDAVTLENKFSVMTYPVPQSGGQEMLRVNTGYGAMAVGPRWLAYPSNNPLSTNISRLSPQNLTSSPGVSPSTSPSNGILVARYAMESSKQLAAGIINLGDVGYKTMSKYYKELSPDGPSSPVSSNSSWKTGRLRSASQSNETDIAGMVVIEDFVSRVIVSQFRAHTSPISALCFDPSGTLLVTASVYGNSINIFRIMPSLLKNESCTPSYDWSNNHVHLYKLYRGLTAAVIRDISFSHYSQWIAIVSSRGTCHIFILSPFGGEVGLQTRNSVSDGPTAEPSLTSPWWSSSSCAINQHSFPPPSPVTLSVISRIKNNSSGWLNTVANAAASATGKVTQPPTGAVAVTFYNSLSRHLLLNAMKGNSLEHLLVYTPSGHLVQHELLPSLEAESSDSDSGTSLGALVRNDEELKVKAQPAQWWNVCRRSNWPEKAENISRVTSDAHEVSDPVGGIFFVKPQEKQHGYLSNAEVQIGSGEIRIWQKSKISFHIMVPSREIEAEFTKDFFGGEVEIEKILVRGVEVKRKDLLPVFDHFHHVKSDQSESGSFAGRHSSNSSFEPYESHFTEDTGSPNHDPMNTGSFESSNSGSSGNPNDFDKMKSFKVAELKESSTVRVNGPERGINVIPSTLLSQNLARKDHLSEQRYNCVINGVSFLKSDFVSIEGIMKVGTPSNGSEVSEISNPSSGRSDPIDLRDTVDFGHCFQEDYCEVSELNGCQKSAEVIHGSYDHRAREKVAKDEEDDDMPGGMFAFSEEG
ncbi:autophagy-related protein 18h-like [Papaver somniferum]|uniref:autophagy-related protein 18h-like n=1 Tax=Papaver somniferum TaxID=3469 RepID=UPI000E6F705F|nr:autophagy-related protein 18h-like [Papaver somniferum]